MTDLAREKITEQEINEICKKIYNDKNITKVECDTVHKLLNEIAALQSDLASEK
jgi:hypothetical protein